MDGMQGMDWTGLDCTVLDWAGMDWIVPYLTGLYCTGLGWNGLDCTLLDWTGLGWNGLDWTGHILSRMSTSGWLVAKTVTELQVDCV